MYEKYSMIPSSEKRRKKAVPRDCGPRPVTFLTKEHPNPDFPRSAGRHYKGMPKNWVAQSFKRQGMC